MNIDKLSEKNLGLILNVLFSEYEVKAQQRCKDVTGKLLIPDYFVDTGEDAFMFEFDGPTHYMSTKTQIRDIKLKSFCELNGILLIRIPYFMQLDSYTLEYFFSKDVVDKYCLYDKMCSINVEYKSGFHDPKIIYPGDFNLFGWYIFFKNYSDLVKVDKMSIMQQIYHSLFDNHEPDEVLGIGWEDCQDKWILYNEYPT